MYVPSQSVKQTNKQTDSYKAQKDQKPTRWNKPYLSALPAKQGKVVGRETKLEKAKEIRK